MHRFGYPKHHLRRYLLMAALLAHGSLAAAASERFYLHDAILLKQLQEASSQLTTEAQQASAASMLRNLDAAAAAGRAGITASERTRQQALLLGLSRLSWERIHACALNSDCETTIEDSCTQITPGTVKGTASKIEDVQKTINQLTLDIAPLAKQIEAGRKKGIDTAPAAPATASAEEPGALLQRLDNLLMAARTGEAADEKSSRKLLDLLSKVKDTDLIKDAATRDLLSKPAATPLPPEWQALLANYGDGGIKTAGDLLHWLGTDDARIAQIREELAADFAAAKIELLQGQLDEKKADLALKMRALALYQKQWTAEKNLAHAFLSDKTPAAPHGCVYAGLQTRQADYRKASTSSHPDTTDIAKKSAALSDYLFYVSTYIERVGYLHEEQLLVDHDSALLQHQQSILRSQRAQAVRMQMVRHGLDGLVSFAEGGVTYDDVNAIVQLLQTALLGVIAGK